MSHQDELVTRSMHTMGNRYGLLPRESHTGPTLVKILRPAAAGSYNNQMTLVSVQMSLVPRQAWQFYRLLVTHGFWDDWMG